MKKLTVKQRVEIINMILNDEEFQAGGIPRKEEYIKSEYGLTQRQFNSLCGKLWKMISKK